MSVIRNPRKGGPRPNNNLPCGASRLADSLDARDLEAAITYGNRATRRLAMRNLRKQSKEGRR